MICNARLASTVVLDLFDQIDKLSYSIDLNIEFWQAINFSYDFEVENDFLILNINVLYRTIFVQLYKTRHEQVLDSILRSKTKILLQVPTLGVLRLGQKKRFRK